MASPTSKVAHPDLLQFMRSTDFDTWSSPQPERKKFLICCMTCFMEDVNVHKELNVGFDTLRSFVTEVCKNYQDVSYHNFHHCFAVTHMVYVVIYNCKMVERIGGWNCAVLLIAAACHDLDHPGLSNSFLKLSADPLAQEFEHSPLEHHHIRRGRAILEQSGMVENLTPSRRAQLYRDMEELILATDLANHSPTMETFKKISLDKVDYDKQEDTLGVMKVILKCCDVSNEARPKGVSRRWAECLTQEFYEEGDKRRERGFDLPLMNDRTKADMPKLQVGFLDKFLLPMVTKLADVVPEVDTLLVVKLRKSLEGWQAECDEAEKK